jgi:hypothetical protein
MVFTNLENLRKLLRIKGAQPTNILQDLYLYFKEEQEVTDAILVTECDKTFFFCSTLSEFENFLLCERILINLTTCQNEM